MEKKFTAFLVLLALFASFTVALECFKLSAHKPFNFDEIFDFVGTLKHPIPSILKTGGSDQIGKSPFYYVIQRITMQKVLSKEKQIQFGWDWRLSMRFVSTILVALGCLIASLILLPMSWGVALALPILMANYSHVVWYGAESRTHSAWLCWSTILYAVAIVFALKPKSILWGLFWVLSCGLITSSGISSVPQVFTLAFSMLLFWILQNKTPGKLKILKSQEAIFLYAGLGVSFLLFKIWMEPRPITFSHFKEPMSYYFQHFTNYALEPLGGTSGLLRFLFFTLMMIVYGYSRACTAGTRAGSARDNVRCADDKISSQSKLFLALGLLCLSQLFLIPLLYVAQIINGYFFSPRHVLFSTTIRALAVGGFVALCYEALTLFFSQKYFKILIGLLLSLSISFDWFHWSVFTIPKSITELKSFYRPYCHMPIAYDYPSWVSKSPQTPVEQVDTETYNFNVLNIYRHSGHHSGQCAPLPKGVRTYDFSPDWIYD